MNNIASFILSLIYPQKCLCCKEIVVNKTEICESCEKSIILNKEKVNIKYFNYVKTPFIYDKAIVNGIINLKFNGRPETSRAWAGYIYNNVKEIFNNNKIDYITFVPMHKNKEKIRGYNQSKLLASFLSKYADVSLIELVHKKTDHTQLHKLGLKDRKKSIEDSFILNEKHLINNKNILIIDDVITTGTTLEEIGKIIKKKYNVNIYGAAIAYALKS